MTDREPARRKIHKVAVISKVGPPEGPALAARLADWLEGQGVEVCFDRRTASVLGEANGFDRDAIPDDSDIAIVAGGDGTLLSVARTAGPQGVPIIGVNLGSLGFLTEIQPEELESGLARLLAGDYTIEERCALHVRYREDGQPDQEYALLNDAVITKGALARMITVDVEVDDELVATYTSDGLILSTPTGSTAYSLSAGGPILDPRMSAFIIAPICPHTMTYRPLVVPGNVTVRVTLRSRGKPVYLTLDGQVGIPMQTGARLEVRQYDRPVKLVRVAGRSFFEVLRRKLRWGER